MRVAVLVLGILGSLGAATLAGIYVLAQGASEIFFQGITNKTTKQAATEGIDPAKLPDPWTLTTAQEWIDGTHWQSFCIWFLAGAFVLGITGAVLGFTRRGFSAAMLLFAAFAAPILIYPGITTVVFPIFLVFAGILALFVKPLPRASGALE